MLKACVISTNVVENLIEQAFLVCLFDLHSLEPITDHILSLSDPSLQHLARFGEVCSQFGLNLRQLVLQEDFIFSPKFVDLLGDRASCLLN